MRIAEYGGGIFVGCSVRSLVVILCSRVRASGVSVNARKAAELMAIDA